MSEKDSKYYAENREAILARARERERLLDPEIWKLKVLGVALNAF